MISATFWTPKAHTQATSPSCCVWKNMWTGSSSPQNWSLLWHGAWFSGWAQSLINFTPRKTTASSQFWCASLFIPITKFSTRSSLSNRHFMKSCWTSTFAPCWTRRRFTCDTSWLGCSLKTSNSSTMTLTLWRGKKQRAAAIAAQKMGWTFRRGTYTDLWSTSTMKKEEPSKSIEGKPKRLKSRSPTPSRMICMLAALTLMKSRRFHLTTT